MAARKNKLEQAKEGLLDGRTKVVRDAAGELVANTLRWLDESPSAIAVSLSRLPGVQNSAGDSYSSSRG